MIATRMFRCSEVLIHVRRRGQVDYQIGVLSAHNQTIKHEGIQIFLVDQNGDPFTEGQTPVPPLNVRVKGDCDRANRFGKNILIIQH